MTNHRILSYVLNLFGIGSIFSLLALIFSKTNKTLMIVQNLQKHADKLVKENSIVNHNLIKPVKEEPIRPTKKLKALEMFDKLKNIELPKCKKSDL